MKSLLIALVAGALLSGTSTVHAAVTGPIVAIVHIQDITPTTDSLVQIGGQIDLIDTSTSPPTISKVVGVFTVSFASFPAAGDLTTARTLAKNPVISVTGKTPNTTYLMGWPQ